ncbi:hypothetical protein [Bacillus sp. V3-13]|nr:hypothetical protein [Bacillus sp. V3-13]
MQGQYQNRRDWLTMKTVTATSMSGIGIARKEGFAELAKGTLAFNRYI